VPLTSAVAS